MMGNHHNSCGGRNVDYGPGNGNRNPENSFRYGAANNNNNIHGNNGYTNKSYMGLENLCSVIIVRF